MADMTNMDQAALVEEIARLTAANAALKASRVHAVSYKVSEKGALSVYGLGRFPVTLYRSQWERLIASAPAISDFIAANTATLKTKE